MDHLENRNWFWLISTHYFCEREWNEENPKFARWVFQVSYGQASNIDDWEEIQSQLKSFDDLIIEFDKDRKKYNYIVNCGILDNFEGQNFDTFYNLILAPKVPRYAYGIMSNKIPPERNQNFGGKYILRFLW